LQWGCWECGLAVGVFARIAPWGIESKEQACCPNVPLPAATIASPVRKEAISRHLQEKDPSPRAVM